MCESDGALSPIRKTAVSRCSDSIFDLLLKCGSDINASSYGRQSVLWHACWCDREEMVRKLVDRGADILAAGPANDYWDTPMKVASSRGNIRQILIDGLEEDAAAPLAASDTATIATAAEVTPLRLKIRSPA